MKWSDCKGAYNAYISLGSTCQTAYQLRRLKLRRFAGPLDWFTSHKDAAVSRLIRNRFEGFMAFNQLELLRVDPTNYIMRDVVYDIVSFHDFPLLYRWTDVYPEFIEKVDRRVKAFLTSTKNGPVCFVRVESSKKEAHKLYEALKSIVPGKFRILIINNVDNDQGVTYEDWGLPCISSVSIPRGVDWRGSSRAWDQIMRGFTLNSIAR